MPTSNFKLFDENKTNAMSDAEYASANQRLNGVQSGIASSKLQNKFQIQASMVAYAIAQLMVQNGYDATDSTAITTFVSNLSNSVLQKVLDKATTAGAIAGTDNTKWMTPALTKSSIAKFAPMLSTILSNETKTLYGLGSNATPDDVFAELGKYKQYWWRRRAKTFIEVKKDITGTVALTQDSTDYARFYYSKTVSIDSTGKVSLNSPTTLNGVASSSSDASSLANDLKPYLDTPPYYVSSKNVNEEVYYVPTGSVIKYSAGNAANFTFGLYREGSRTFYMMLSDNSFEDAGVPAQLVNGSIQLGDWQYVQSSNRNAYPDSGISGGYEYEYLGIPFDNSVTAPKIETGSYVGTGTYGQANPNTLTFDFVPALVVIVEVSVSSLYPGIVFVNGQTECSGIGSNSNYVDSYGITISWTGKTVSWYASKDGTQLNKSGTLYRYFAIGR